MTSVEQIAAAVLYEGYILWPYRRSARKNQQRWTFGGIYPRMFSESSRSQDPWRMQTQCLVISHQATPVVAVRVRFLQVVERRVARRVHDGALEFVDELRIGTERYLSWDEAREREFAVSEVPLSEAQPQTLPFEIPAAEELQDIASEAVVIRTWRALQGHIEVTSERIQEDLFQLTVSVENTLPLNVTDRDAAQRHAFVSTHTILTVRDGEFVSLIDPPSDLKHLTEKCQNLNTWPVLAGEEAQRQTLLSSPIILYDYPRIAPESHGDLFDAGEIDQLLALNILTLTDDEKSEMRATDPRVREILDRTEAFTAEDFRNLHGTIREMRILREEGPVNPLFNEVERAVPRSVRVGDVDLAPGSRVRLRPHAGRDIMDVVLAGKIAIVEGIEQDYDERVHLAVTVEDDPGRDLGRERMIGHRFFFSPDEVEPA